MPGGVGTSSAAVSAVVVGASASSLGAVDMSSIESKECFGLLLTITNKDSDGMKLLWETGNYWVLTHLNYLIEQLLLQGTWTEGFKILLQPQSTSKIYSSLNFETKENFISSLTKQLLDHANTDLASETLLSISSGGVFTLVLLLHLCTIASEKRKEKTIIDEFESVF